MATRKKAEGNLKGTRPRVVIFGAGITGLSAAHELIERGFDVQVVEKRPSLTHEYAVEVGGIAATQPGAVRAEPARLHPNYYLVDSAEYLQAVDRGEVDDPIVAEIHHTWKAEEGKKQGKASSSRESSVDLGRRRQLELVEQLHAVPMQRSRKPIPATETIRFPKVDAPNDAVTQGAEYFDCMQSDDEEFRELDAIEALLEWEDQHGVTNELKLERLAFRLARGLIERLRLFGQDLRAAERYTNAPVGRYIEMSTLRRETMLAEVRGHTNRDLQGDVARQLGRIRAACIKRLLAPRIGELLSAEAAQDEIREHLSGIFRARTWSMTSRDRASWIQEQTSDFVENIGDHFVIVSLAAETPLGKWWRGRERSDRVDFRFVEILLPGEHGYRYFPAYYRHLFNTMKRTPILDTRGEETGETAFSQLLTPPPTEISFRDDDTKIHRIARRRYGSFKEAREAIDTMLEHAGMTSKDVQRFMLRMFVFLTSSKGRRETWQNQTWMEFLDGVEPPVPFPDSRFNRAPDVFEGSKFSRDAIALISGTARSLLAMDSDEADAYSYGLNACQLLLDFLKDGRGTDMTLNGPTSYSWLDPWKSYLKRQGVQFFVGELVGMVQNKDEDRHVLTNHLLPRAVWYAKEEDRLFEDTIRRDRKIELEVTTEEDDESDADREEKARARTGPWLPVPENPDHEYFGYRSERAEKEGEPDFYIMALPFEHASRTAYQADKRSALDGDWERLSSFDTRFMKRDKKGNDLVQWASTRRDKKSTREEVTGRPKQRMKYPLRDLSGIQFFFPHNERVGQGHVIYGHAEWGLTSISQVGLWRNRVSRREGFLGQISVDIGAFYEGHTMKMEDHAYLAGAEPAVHKHLGYTGRRIGKNEYVGRTAWKSEWWEIPIRVWDQIVRSVEQDSRRQLEPPRYYHLDAGLIFRAANEDEKGYWIGRTTKKSKRRRERYQASYPARNETPFLINLPGQWSHRPGQGDEGIDYQVSNGNWLLAGTYMATHTRIMTMEACNESARHAVNAILEAIRIDEPKCYRSGGKSLGVPCKIWDLYENELPDLDPLKELDEKLFEKNLPHFSEILEWDQMISDQPAVESGKSAKLAIESTTRYRELAQETLQQMDQDLAFLDRYLPEGRKRRKLEPLGEFAFDYQKEKVGELEEGFARISGTDVSHPARARLEKGAHEGALESLQKEETLFHIAQLFILGAKK